MECGFDTQQTYMDGLFFDIQVNKAVFNLG